MVVVGRAQPPPPPPRKFWQIARRVSHQGRSPPPPRGRSSAKSQGLGERAEEVGSDLGSLLGSLLERVSNNGGQPRVRW